jgi:ankyrin repeat protein
LLLESGVNVNLADRHGRTPLHYACNDGLFEFTVLLVKNGADVNLADNDGRAPMFYACFKGFLER